jgi:hypothetical protein
MFYPHLSPILASRNVCLITFVHYARLRMVISESVPIDEGHRNCLETTGLKNKSIPFFSTVLNVVNALGLQLHATGKMKSAV